MPETLQSQVRGPARPIPHLHSSRPERSLSAFAPETSRRLAPPLHSGLKGPAVGGGEMVTQGLGLHPHPPDA